MGKTAVAILLSGAERRGLESLVRRRRTGQGLALRARIVLAAAEGLENKAIVERVGAVANTLGKWRRRFAARGLDGLYDAPRPGAPRRIGDDEVAEVVRRTREETPPDATHSGACVRWRAPQAGPLDDPSHQVPAHHRGQCPGRPGCPLGSMSTWSWTMTPPIRPRRSASGSPASRAGTSTLPRPALHPDRGLLAEPGRALLRPAHRKSAPTRRPSLHQGTRRGYPHRQRAVPAGIGMHLGAVKRHRAQLQHPRLARQHQDLHEKTFDLRQKTTPEGRDGVVVGMIVHRYETKRHGILGRTLQLPARKHTRGVTVNQQAEKQARVIGRGARPAIGLHHRRKVQLINHLHDKACKVTFRQPLIHRRRQEEACRAINMTEITHRYPGRTDPIQFITVNRTNPAGSSPTGC